MPKKVVVIAGPSGSGKNTVIKQIMQRYPKAAKLVTATTRMKRPDEQEGVDYYFFDIQRFDSEESQGHIHGKRYLNLFGGTHYGIFTPDLEQKLQSASVVFAPVDITGAEWLKQNYNATTIFIVPESLAEYRMRIHARNPEMSAKELEERMKIAEREVSIDAPQYDYRVVNTGGMLMQTTDQIIEILQKEGYSLA
jgi:guanylate kinase